MLGISTPTLSSAELLVRHEPVGENGPARHSLLALVLFPVVAVAVPVETPILVDKRPRVIRFYWWGPCWRLVIHPGAIWRAQVRVGSGCQVEARQVFCVASSHGGDCTLWGETFLVMLRLASSSEELRVSVMLLRERFVLGLLWRVEVFVGFCANECLLPSHVSGE